MVRIHFASVHQDVVVTLTIAPAATQQTRVVPKINRKVVTRSRFIRLRAASRPAHRFSHT